MALLRCGVIQDGEDKACRDDLPSPTGRRLEKDIANDCSGHSKTQRAKAAAAVRNSTYSGRSHFTSYFKDRWWCSGPRTNVLPDGCPSPTKDPESPRWHPLSKMNAEVKSGSNGNKARDEIGMLAAEDGERSRIAAKMLSTAVARCLRSRSDESLMALILNHLVEN